MIEVGLLTLFENEDLKFGTYVPSTVIKTLISNWQEVYGKREVWMQIDACCRENPKCKIKPTTFKIKEGVTHLTSEFRVRLMNPIKKDYEALDMTIRFSL